MILMVLLPLIAVAIVCALPRGGTAARWNIGKRRLSHTVRYRFKRVKLPQDWWDQFERDFAAYVDPRAARARDRERS